MDEGLVMVADIEKKMKAMMGVLRRGGVERRGTEEVE